MPKTALIEMEMKVREITWVNNPSPEFIETLWQKIENKELLPMKPFQKRALYQRPAFIILIVALLLLGALFIGFGPQKVSAFLRNIFSSYDPGLQDVEEAGLVTDMDMVAEPVLLPKDDLTSDTHQVYLIGQSQTIDGNTVTLDWGYADEGRLALAYTMDAQQEGLTLGAPALAFNGFTPAQQSGSMVALDVETQETIAIAYQTIQVDVVGEMINFSVDLPLVNSEDPTQEPVAQFHFDVESLPLYRGFTIFMQQTYQVTLNGISVQLKSVQVSPGSTDVTICSEPENKGVPIDIIQEATFQFGEGPEVPLSSQHITNSNPGQYCSAMRFATNNPENSMTAKLTVNSLLAEDSESPINGPWTYYMDIPTMSLFTANEAPWILPTPIASQTQADVTVTLDWVFVDALRAAVGFTITGLPDMPEAAGLLGQISMNDADGNPIWGSGIGSIEINRTEDKPGVIQGSWSVGLNELALEDEIQLQWVLTLDGSSLNNYIAGFPVDPEATPNPSGTMPTFLPEGYVGTYTFDFTAEVQPMTVIENLPAVTVNGIQMLVPKALVTPSMTQAMICYQKPTERDWWIWNASVGNFKEQSSMIGGDVIYDTDYTLKPGTGADGELWVVPTEFQNVEHGRCLILNFLQGQSNPNEPLVLTVGELQISPPEDVPESEIEAAREILKAQGIEFDYWTMQGQGGGGGGVTFTVLPEGMKDEEAYRKYNEALGYLFPGPWTITLIN